MPTISIYRLSAKHNICSTAHNVHQTSNFSELTISPGKEVQVTTCTAVNSPSNLVLKTPFSPATAATAAGDVFAEEPVATVAHTGAVSTKEYRFPDQQVCDSVVQLADTLPDLVFVPFDDAVSDMVLQGWEDDWISIAHYSGPKLEEPKIDFVYNCESSGMPSA